MSNGNDQSAAIARHLANMVELGRRPGVRSVGFGLKESGGEVRPVWAYRVYVERKLANGELSPSERLPERVDGFCTDVVVAGQKLPTTKTPSLRPGVQIQRGLLNDAPFWGTLGLIVLKDGERHILTNAHVLEDAHHSEFPHVYSPERKRSAGIDCRNPAAEVIQGNGIRRPRRSTLFDPYQRPYRFRELDFDIDAALARILDGVESSNVFGQAPIDRELHDLIPAMPTDGDAPASVIRVEKRGARTGHTVGTVVRYFSAHTPEGEDTPLSLFELEIRPEGSAFPYRRDYVMPAGAQVDQTLEVWRGSTVRATSSIRGGRPVLHLEGTVFSMKGDSGSAVVLHSDDARAPRKVVGLLHSCSTGSVLTPDGLHTPEDEPLYLGPTQAAYILPVFDAMGLSPSAAIVPGAPSAAEAIELPPAWEGAEHPTLAELEGVLRATEAGRRLADLALLHYPELAELVHHRRRVKVAWYRLKGPAWVAELARTRIEDSAPLPRTLDGLDLVEALTRFGQVLSQEGSPELRAALQEHSERLLALARARTVGELKRVLAC